MAVSKRLRYEILRRDNHACRYCGASAPSATLTVDHVLPTALGGDDKPDNLVAACGPCNSGKTSSAPDAPIVADVTQAAVQWAQAMALAAQEAMNDSANREKALKDFLAAWRRRSGPELPEDWRGSIDSLIAAGLPPTQLAECVNIAMDRDSVTDARRFKYTCGVAWRKIDKLRERAKELAGITDADDGLDAPATALDTSKGLLSILDENEREIHLDGVRAEHGDQPDVVLHYRAAEAAVEQLTWERFALQQAVRELLDASGAGDRYIDAAHKEHEANLGRDFTFSAVLAYAARLRIRDQREEADLTDPHPSA